VEDDGGEEGTGEMKQKPPPNFGLDEISKEMQKTYNSSKEIKKLKKNLLSLTIAIKECLNRLDVEMKNPSCLERGKRIAKICNNLEFANDHARYFVLDIDYRKEKKEQDK
jgi:Na+/phosphate symporter